MILKHLSNDTKDISAEMSSNNIKGVLHTTGFGGNNNEMSYNKMRDENRGGNRGNRNFNNNQMDVNFPNNPYRDNNNQNQDKENNEYIDINRGPNENNRFSGENRGFRGNRDNYRGNRDNYRGRGNNRFGSDNQRGNDNYRGRGNYRGGDNDRNYGNRNFNNFNNQNNDNGNSGVYNNPYNNDHKSNDNYYYMNKEIIDEIIKNFTNLNSHSAIEVIKVIMQGAKKTIFELINQFARHNVITKTLKGGNHIREYSDHISIYESEDNFILPLHEYAMVSYKTIPLKENEDAQANADKYVSGEDKRRAVKKNTDGFFNYIPLMCKNHNLGSVLDHTLDDCPYAHSHNEVNYHPLQYKTQLCYRLECKDAMCPNVHGLGEDLRKIYDYTSNDIMHLAVKLDNSPLFSKKLIPYKQLIPLPTKFSLDTFKVSQCKFGICDLDPHLCLSYHDIKERRRPPKLFQLINEICEKSKPDKLSDFYPHLCDRGDYCNKIHTRYELLYHEDFFRKIRQCNRPKENGRCIFFTTCYGIHPEDLDEKIDLNFDSYRQDILKNTVPKQEYDDVVSKLNKSIRNLKIHSCHCCKIFSEIAIYVFTSCKHIMCRNCLAKMLKSPDNMKCLVCQAVIEKNSLIKIDFNIK